MVGRLKFGGLRNLRVSFSWWKGAKRYLFFDDLKGVTYGFLFGWADGVFFPTISKVLLRRRVV